MPFLASCARFEDLIGQSLTVYISPFVPISLFKLINVCTLNWSVYSSCEFITRNQTKKVYSTLTANLFHCSFRRVVFLNTLTNKGQKVRLGQYFNIQQFYGKKQQSYIAVGLFTLTFRIHTTSLTSNDLRHVAVQDLL